MNTSKNKINNSIQKPKHAAVLIIGLILLVTSTSGFTEENEEKSFFSAEVSTTRHTAKINNEKIEYKVISGDTVLLDDAGKQKAAIFSTAYFRTNKKKSKVRPVIFVFNGGPGSSSVWLHLGVFGPKIVELPSDAKQVPAAPYNVKANSLSLLDIADLVFIDPVGTGYSIALGEYEGKDFWGVKQDATIMSAFVRHFITQYELWNSPKYLAGESYGTTRAALMVKELQEGWGSIDLNGVFLISSIVDFQTGDFNPGNDLPFITFLPTYAATAWYHNVIPDKTAWKSLSDFIQEVKFFALNEYASALMQGVKLSDVSRQQIVNRLYSYTGLSKRYIEQTDLRIDEMLFMKELLREQGKSVGRLDSRYLGVDASNVESRFETDPSGYAIDGAYTAAIHAYLASDLKVKRQTPYHILSGKVFSSWDWLYDGSARSQGFLNTSQFLSKAQRQNPSFKIFIANGYYDLATPFFATEYSFSRSGFDQNRITMKYYEAGHMMYIHQPSLEKLVNDMRKFLKGN